MNGQAVNTTQFTADEILRSIGHAMRAGEMLTVSSLLSMLATKDPKSAAAIHNEINRRAAQ